MFNSGPSTGKVQVRVFLNTDRDAWSGYSLDHEIVEVAAYLADAGCDQAVLDDAFRLFNVGDDPNFGPPDPRAVAYRERKNRSLSVGDVVAIGDRYHSCEAVGWRELATNPTISAKRGRGVAPLCNQAQDPGKSWDHPPTHAGCQVFQFLMFRWCITLAEELIGADATAAEYLQRADITGVRHFLSLDRAGDQGGLVFVQSEYAMTTDLEKPILICPVLHRGESLGNIVIDGWHRVHHALTIGRTSLPAWTLTAETAAACSLPTLGTPD